MSTRCSEQSTILASSRATLTFLSRLIVILTVRIRATPCVVEELKAMRTKTMSCGAVASDATPGGAYCMATMSLVLTTARTPADNSDSNSRRRRASSQGCVHIDVCRGLLCSRTTCFASAGNWKTGRLRARHCRPSQTERRRHYRHITAY